MLVTCRGQWCIMLERKVKTEFRRLCLFISINCKERDIMRVELWIPSMLWLRFYICLYLCLRRSLSIACTGRRSALNAVGVSSTTSIPFKIPNLSPASPVLIDVIIEEGSLSFFREKPEKRPVLWYDALAHISDKLGWDGDNIELRVTCEYTPKHA